MRSSDFAAKHAKPMPAFAEATKDELGQSISALGQMPDRIDLTGAAVPDPTLWRKVLDAVPRDSRVGLTICAFDLIGCCADTAARRPLTPPSSPPRPSIRRAAMSLGPDLAAFEVNPLLVPGDAVEALDALAVWSS